MFYLRRVFTTRTLERRFPVLSTVCTDSTTRLTAPPGESLRNNSQSLRSSSKRPPLHWPSQQSFSWFIRVLIENVQHCNWVVNHDGTRQQTCMKSCRDHIGSTPWFMPTSGIQRTQVYFMEQSWITMKSNVEWLVDNILGSSLLLESTRVAATATFFTRTDTSNKSRTNKSRFII